MAINHTNLIALDKSELKAGQRVMRLPDGSIVPIGVDGSITINGTDTSQDTVTADVLLEGYTAHDKDGNHVTGNIPTVTASSDGTTVTVPVGYIAVEQSFPISSGGTDTSDATASPEDVLAGEIFYNADGRQVGTLVPSTGDTIDLSFITATAGDIRSGKVGADVNGNPVNGTLVVESAGGGTDMYKCASVNAATKKWSGYKAIVDPQGGFSFENELTSDLEMGYFIPINQRVYPANGAFEARYYRWTGLPAPILYYVSESEGKNIVGCTPTTVPNGGYWCGEIQVMGTIIWDTYKTGTIPGFPAAGYDFAFSFWKESDPDIIRLYRPSTGGDHRVRIFAEDGKICFDIEGTVTRCNPPDGVDLTALIDERGMHHWLLNYTGSTLTYDFYIDGVLFGSAQDTTARELNYIYLYTYKNWIASIRGFDQKLTNDQIQILANEWKVLEGIYVTGLPDIETDMYWGPASGLYKENGKTNGKPRYSLIGEDGWDVGAVYIQWNGTSWIITYNTYDWETDESVDVILGIGQNGDTPAQAGWFDSGYGVPVVTEKYLEK